MKYSESIETIFIRLVFSLAFAVIFWTNNPEIKGFSVVGIALFIYYGLSFYSKLGNTLPIKELIITIALIQWVIAPILSYHFFKSSEFYYMCIDEEKYMGFVIPGTIAFITGLMLPIGGAREVGFKKEVIENPRYYNRRGILLIIIGFISFFVSPFLPKSLNYLGVLLTNIAIIGSFYLYKGKYRYKYLFLFAALLPIFNDAKNSTTFHELFIWSGFMLIIITFINKSNFATKTLLLALATFLIFIINSVKQDYRDIVWADQIANGTPASEYQQMNNMGGEKEKDKSSGSQLLGLVGDKIKNKDKENENVNNEINDQSFVDRLNQGWIIARIMYVVPQYENFARGETIWEGIEAALLPRLLDPNKATSGGSKNFERFTGLSLAGASMNLGIIGEAYANYDENGGIFFLLIYGLFFNIVFYLIIRRSTTIPEVILWLPFLFFYVIKAEEDFTSIFNQFVKSVMLMVVILYLLKGMVNENLILEEVQEPTKN